MEALGLLVTYRAHGVWTDNYDRERRCRGAEIRAFRPGSVRALWRSQYVALVPVDGEGWIEVVGTATTHGRPGPNAEAARALLTRASETTPPLF